MFWTLLSNCENNFESNFWVKLNRDFDSTFYILCVYDCYIYIYISFIYRDFFNFNKQLRKLWYNRAELLYVQREQSGMYRGNSIIEIIRSISFEGRYDVCACHVVQKKKKKLKAQVEHDAWSCSELAVGECSGQFHFGRNVLLNCQISWGSAIKCFDIDDSRDQYTIDTRTSPPHDSPRSSRRGKKVTTMSSIAGNQFLPRLPNSLGDATASAAILFFCAHADTQL